MLVVNGREGVVKFLGDQADYFANQGNKVFAEGVRYAARMVAEMNIEGGPVRINPVVTIQEREAEAKRTPYEELAERTKETLFPKSPLKWPNKQAELIRKMIETSEKEEGELTKWIDGLERKAWTDTLTGEEFEIPPRAVARRQSIATELRGARGAVRSAIAAYREALYKADPSARPGF